MHCECPQFPIHSGSHFLVQIPYQVHTHAGVSN